MSESAGAKLKYVYRCLQLNPAKQAERILDERAIALGLPTRVPVNGAAEIKKRQARRQKLQQELDSIRTVFWTAPGAQVQANLQRLDVDDFPELKKGVERMLHLSEIREQVNGLMGLPHSNANLVLTIKRVMMLPPIEAGRVKDEYLLMLPFHESLASVKSMIRVLKNRFPQVFQMEQAWFEQILASKAGRRYIARRQTESSGESESYFQEMSYSFFVIVFFLVLFARIIHLATR